MDEEFKSRMMRAAKEGNPMIDESHSGGFKTWKDDDGRDFARPVPSADVFLAKCQRANLEYAELSNLSGKQREALNKLEFGNTNAILHGDPGTGKTAICLMALFHHHMKGESVRLHRWEDIRVMFQPQGLDESGHNPSSLAKLMAENKLMLIDELGHGNLNLAKATDHECRVLQNIISARDSAHNFTWITCNQDLARLKDLYGGAIYSRLMRHGARFTMDFNGGKDYRIGG